MSTELVGYGILKLPKRPRTRQPFRRYPFISCLLSLLTTYAWFLHFSALNFLLSMRCINFSLVF